MPTQLIPVSILGDVPADGHPQRVQAENAGTSATTNSWIGSRYVGG